MLRKHLKAYTLIYAIMVVIVATSFALLFLAYFQINYKLVDALENRTFSGSYCYDGLSVLNKSNKYDQLYFLSLQDGYNIRAIKKRWGAYDLYYSTVLNNNSDTLYARIALVGFGRDSSDKTILFLRNTNSPLNIGDSVSLDGDCFIPSGYMKFFINTHFAPLPSFHIHSSPDTLVQPLETYDLIDWLQKMPMNKEPRITISDSISKSFTEETLIISADTIIISGIIKENVLVVGKVIKILKGASLNDIILAADEIVFPDRFKGRVQAIASHTIDGGNNDTFSYPSMLLLLPEWKNHSPTEVYYINMGDSLNIQGEIYASTARYDQAIKTHVKLNSNALIRGSVYSSGTITFTGNCQGSVFCEKLMASNAQGIQPNLLRNTQIIPAPSFFSYCKLYPFHNAQKVLKWLK